GGRKNKMRDLELDASEWTALEDLMKVLKLYKDLTLKFSQEGVTTIAHVIPSMDRIDQMLTTSRQDAALNPAVAAALINAKRVMNKYYSKTDLSYVYRIAMTLHPGLKLRYFQAHKWTQEWIDEAL
ncbi:hypothetical protein C8J57DRAFT_993600, partial [Mycena rebaudengoi]